MYSWRKSFSSHAPTLFIFMFSSTDDQRDDGDDDGRRWWYVLVSCCRSDPTWNRLCALLYRSSTFVAMYVVIIIIISVYKVIIRMRVQTSKMYFYSLRVSSSIYHSITIYCTSHTCRGSFKYHRSCRGMYSLIMNGWDEIPSVYNTVWTDLHLFASCIYIYI